VEGELLHRLNMPLDTPYGQHLITQVVTSYEVLGLNPHAIAEQLDIEEGAEGVEEILRTNSDLYVAHLRQAGALAKRDPANTAIVVTPEEAEYQRLKKMYMMLAETAPESSVRERAIRWLLDEAKGRNHTGVRQVELKEREIATRSSQEERLAKFNALIRQTFATQGTPAPNVTVIDVLPEQPKIADAN
jgi:hypothetical protein